MTRSGLKRRGHLDQGRLLTRLCPERDVVWQAYATQLGGCAVDLIPRPTASFSGTRLQPKPGDSREAHQIFLEVAKDRDFKKIETRAFIPITAETDWTCRFCAARLKPSTEYWYRFTDEDGNGSRVGRTLPAPRERDARPVRFTFVSCQDMSIGAANAYRRRGRSGDTRSARSRGAAISLTCPMDLDLSGRARASR